MITRAHIGLLGRFSALFGGRLAGAVAMLATTLLIANFFGAAALAEFALYTSAVSILSVVLLIGFSQVGTLFAAEYAAKRQLGRLKGFIITSIAHIAAGAAIVAAAGGLLVAFLPQAVSPERLPFFALTWLAAIATAGLYLVGSIMVGLKQQVRGLLPETLLRPVMLLVFVLLAAIAATVDDILTILMLHALTIWMSFGVALFLARGKLAELRALPAAFEPARWRRAAYPWMAISVSWDFMIDMLVLLTGLIAERTDVAVLYVCFRLRVLAGFGMRSIYLLMISSVAGSKAVGELQMMKWRLGEINLASIAYAVALMIVFAVAGTWLLGWFGEEMAVGYTALLVIASVMVSRAVFGPAPAVLAMHNLHMASAIIMVAGLGVATALVLVLYPLYGVLGVAIAYATANFLVMGILWRHAKAKTGVDCSIFAAGAPAAAWLQAARLATK